ncbi:MAG: hypothetical protein CFE24_07015 [Flavobacterium sp. BFFFF2]|nr:MAG: hypothetical protein CFE24_07015 [Flavobacterium sp. BFFFF2]
MKRAKKVFSLIFVLIVVFCLGKIGKLNRRFFSVDEENIMISCIIDGDYIYFVDGMYLGFGLPDGDYIKFDRSNYTYEMNDICIFKLKGHETVITYENGICVKNLLPSNYQYWSSEAINKSQYCNDIIFGKNVNKILFHNFHVYRCFFNL